MFKLTSLVFIASIFLAAQSNASLTNKDIATISGQVINSARANALSWKIGDGLNFALMVKGVAIGSVSMKYEAENQKEMLMTQVFNLVNKSVSLLIGYDKESGRVSSFKIMGVPLPLPGSDAGGVKVVKQEESHINVPAGEYDAVYFLIETDKGQQTEIWMNPSEIPLTGTLKTNSKVRNIDVSMELVSFAHGN